MNDQPFVPCGCCCPLCGRPHVVPCAACGTAHCECCGGPAWADRQEYARLLALLARALRHVPGGLPGGADARDT